MREYLLYLGGPIRGLSYGESTDWRAYVASKMPRHIKVLSPMRAKKYLSGEKILGNGYEAYPLSSQRGTNSRDRFDVGRCDMLFFNFLGAMRVSIGSVKEIGWADAWRKPMVIVMEPEGNIHDHVLIREAADFRVTTLDLGSEIVISVLTPGV